MNVSCPADELPGFGVFPGGRQRQDARRGGMASSWALREIGNDVYGRSDHWNEYGEAGFQLHAFNMEIDGVQALKLTRTGFWSTSPPCLMAKEACG